MIVNNRPGSASVWILNPVLDILFGCGGFVWLLFLFHYYVLGPSDFSSLCTSLIFLSGVGAIAFAETHTIATFYTLWRSGGRSIKAIWRFKLLALLCALLSVISLVFHPVLPVLVKIYLLLVPHHFIMQSYGVAIVYCLKCGYKLGLFEKRLLMLFIRSAVAFAVLRQLTFKTWSGTTFLMQEIPFWGPVPEWPFLCAQIILIASAMALCFLLISRMVLHDEVFPLPAQMCLLSGITAFVLDPAATGIYWLYVSAFMHGTQYLMIVIAKHSGVDRRERNGSLLQRLKLKPGTIRLVMSVAALTALLYFALPYGITCFGLPYAEAAAAIFVAINLFHIITDGMIWKLKEHSVRDSLVRPF